MATSPRAELRHLVAAALLIGGVATLWGYQYGTGNQTEYILAAERALDGNFLSRDFFSNTTASFGPRTYFTLLVASLGAILPLPVVFFLFAVATNAATSLVTALAGRELFGSSRAGVLGACMVMSLDTLRLGDAARLASPSLLQATLAIPLLLCAIWASLRSRPLLCGVFAGVASVLHPLVGGEAGAVALVACTIMIVAQHVRGGTPGPVAPLRDVVLGWVALIALMSLSLLPYARMERIGSPEFIHILAHFRAPHHYLPSSFPRRSYLEAASFVGAALFAWYAASKRMASLHSIAATAAITTGLVLLACLGGYLFVEVVPTRLWTSGQTFRLLFVVKWLGFLGAAGIIANRLRIGAEEGGETTAAPLLLGVMSAETMLLTQAVETARSWTGSERADSRIGVVGLVGVAAVIAWVELTRHGNALFLILTMIGLLVFSGAVSPWRTATGGLVATAVVAALFTGRGNFPKPVLTLAGVTDQAAAGLMGVGSGAVGISAAVREWTPEDAVVLTPPLFGMLRLFARRAIVADFKVFPFGDRDMERWYQRLVDCYGPVSSAGFPAAREMDARYRKITDARMKEIGKRYGASFAVLYADTQTAYPVVATADGVKLVALPASPLDRSTGAGAGGSPAPRPVRR
jgi:hypothetical protein